MSDPATPIDLGGPIAHAIDTAADRGHPVTLAYVGDDGAPALSIRGSAHVHGRDQLAVWARATGSGLVPAIAVRPQVSVLYFATDDAVPKMLLTLSGRARVAPELSDEVYGRIGAGERERDPEAAGVAVLIDVDRVTGMRQEGPIDQRRA
jgi:hypothetical protein